MVLWTDAVGEGEESPRPAEFGGVAGQPGNVLDCIDITTWDPGRSKQGLPGDYTPPWRLYEGLRQPEPWVIWLGIVLQFFRSRITSRNSSALPVHLNSP